MSLQCVKCEQQFKPPKGADRNSLVRCPHCSATQRLADSRPMPPDDAAVGWLVVHDENTHRQVYELKRGENTIGRQSSSTPADIMIEFPAGKKDTYMSRQHCVIKAVPRSKGKGFEYLLQDKSKNGTIVNVDQKNKLVKEIDIIYLAHNDVVQMGRTKIILQAWGKADNIHEAANNVAKNSFSETIILKP